MVLTTTDIRSGSHEGCRWCRFILSEIVRSPDLLVEGLGKTVAVKLKLGLNITNARDRWYHSLHISNADYYLYAGIVAELILGMIYGRPLANILPADWESTFTVLGYLGLIGIVFEGICSNLSLYSQMLMLTAFYQVVCQRI